MCTAWVSTSACVCRLSRRELHAQEPSCLLHKVLQCRDPAASLGCSRRRGPGGGQLRQAKSQESCPPPERGTGCQWPPCCDLTTPTCAVSSPTPQHTLRQHLGHLPSQADLWLGEGKGGREGELEAETKVAPGPILFKALQCLLVTGTGTPAHKPGCSHPPRADETHCQMPVTRLHTLLRAWSPGTLLRTGRNGR